MRASQQNSTTNVAVGSFASKTIKASGRSISAVPPKAEVKSRDHFVPLSAKSGVHALQQPSSLDDLVGTEQKRLRDGQAERRGGRQVDDEVELGQIGRASCRERLQ